MPVNVLLVITNTEYGGGHRTVEIIAGALPREQFNLHVACDAKDPFWRRMGELGVCRHEVCFGSSVALGRAAQLARIIRQEQIGLVHSQSRRADYYALLAAHRCHVPIISHVSARTQAFDVPGLLKGAYRLMERWMEKRFDLQIAVSESVKQALLTAGVPPERVLMIPEAIDTAAYAPNRAARDMACKQLGLDPSKRWVGSLGRFIPLKGYDVFIKAAAQLRQSPDIGCLVAGTGPLEDELKRLAQQLRLGNGFEFLPFQDDPAAVYAALDVLVFPSLWGEAFPRVLLEALAFGKPVIASDIPAAHDVLGTGQFARFVPAGDAAALAAAIRLLVQDQAGLAQLGPMARQYAVDQYDLKRLIPRVAQAYLAVVDRR